ncbi:MAG: HEAT repeat domain-containing protein [Cyanobacteria bacterium P01_H01_bin.150]
MNHRIYSALSLLTFLIFLNDKPSVAVERIVSQALPNSVLSQNRESAKPIVVSELVEQLRTADVRKRREIIRELSDSSKQDIVPQLVKATSDPDPLVKSAVAEVLGNLTDAAIPAIPALVEMISSTQRAIVPSSYLISPRLSSLPVLPRFRSTRERRIPPEAPENPENLVRITAIAALGKIGLPARKAATPALIEALEDTNPWVKLNATWALAEIGASTPLLAYWLEAIQHPDPKLRSSAAGIFLDSRSLLRKVFGSEADASTTTPLIAALKDEDSRVRDAASQGLELLGTRALTGLIQELKAPEPIVRLEAAKLLGDMGGAAQSAVPTLVELLRDTARYIPQNTNQFGLIVLPPLPRFSVRGKYSSPPGNPDKMVRVNAAIALGKLGDRKAVPALTTALKDNNPWMQLATNWALLRFGQNQGLPVVGRLLEYPKGSVQREALSQLKQYGSQSDPYLLPYYKVRLDSADDNERNQAIIEVGRMGVAALNLVPKLRTILSGNQKDSSGYAATILGQIARDTAAAWQNENLSPQQRQQAVTEFTKVLRIMEAPNAQFNREPRDRVRNALTRLKSIK